MCTLLLQSWNGDKKVLSSKKDQYWKINYFIVNQQLFHILGEPILFSPLVVFQIVILLHSFVSLINPNSTSAFKKSIKL